MAWVDWNYYVNQYRGRKLDGGEFDRLAAAAQRYVDGVTFGRVSEPVIEDVKKAVCAVMDAIRTNESGGGVSSERVGDYAVNYVAGISKAKTENQRLREAVQLHLGRTGLLYRGRDGC